MSIAHLIKSAHIWVVVMMLFGAIVFAGNAGSNTRDLAQQNQNQNSNANQNQNRNANQNANVVTNRNTNNSNATATGGEAGTSALSNRDQKFITAKAMSGMMEVELGRWAAQKGTSEAVKAFGRRVVEDHSKVNTELTQLASSKGVTLATELDRKHQSNISRISRLTGEEFDRAFSKMMLKSHEASVKDFEKQSTSADDADLKAFASKTLPTLQEHLTMARTLPGNAGSGGGNTNSNSNMNMNSNSNSNSNSNRNTNNSNSP